MSEATALDDLTYAVKDLTELGWSWQDILGHIEGTTGVNTSS